MWKRHCPPGEQWRMNTLFIGTVASHNLPFLHWVAPLTLLRNCSYALNVFSLNEMDKPDTYGRRAKRKPPL